MIEHPENFAVAHTDNTLATSTHNIWFGGRLRKSNLYRPILCMGESFQDYSWIQYFEADFLWKVSLKMLN